MKIGGRRGCYTEGKILTRGLEDFTRWGGGGREGGSALLKSCAPLGDLFASDLTKTVQEKYYKKTLPSTRIQYLYLVEGFTFYAVFSVEL
jgi:hypothetical protein